jgi:hypothetical protein
MDIRPPVTGVGVIRISVFLLIGGTFWHMNAASRLSLYLLLADIVLLSVSLAIFRKRLLEHYRRAHKKGLASCEDRPIPAAPFFRKMAYPLFFTAATSVFAVFRGAGPAGVFLSDAVAAAFLAALYQAKEQGFICMNTGLYRNGTFRYRAWCIVFWSAYVVFSVLPFFTCG